MWGQKDYRLYPPQYGDPFYRGRGRGRERGRQDWINERPTERPNGGIRRGNTHLNNRDVREEIHQINTTREQQDRQEEDWSVPTSIERREDVTVRQELHRAPPTSPPQRIERIDYLLTGVVWIPLEQGHCLEIFL